MTALFSITLLDIIAQRRSLVSVTSLMTALLSGSCMILRDVRLLLGCSSVRNAEKYVLYKLNFL